MNTDTSSHRWSVAPAQRALDHEPLGADIHAAFARVVARLRSEVDAFARRMADVGSVELVERDGGAQLLYRAHHGEDHGEGMHRLIGSVELHLTHDGKAAIHMRIRGDLPPAEVLDFDRVTADHLRTRLHAFEMGCRRLPMARAA
ncbi:hypothetical protein [Azospirillum lipoferum]|uniref:Uncharacterized protein n=1 Tax=Azospirillum lipoferum (strain 4B) TaxID=862719 RepID=G7ZE50_AZOL4|nr:hypothetical protein [Azospirillum lipoferum]CBS89890.1 protein of unknown function [Azospirillum lipoferum 4B]